MGILDRFKSSSSGSNADPGMTSRLDKVAKLSVEHVDIPTEFRPTDLEAWLFAPSGTRVGVLGDPQASQGQPMPTSNELGRLIVGIGPFCFAKVPTHAI